MRHSVSLGRTICGSLTSQILISRITGQVRFGLVYDLPDLVEGALLTVAVLQATSRRPSVSKESSRDARPLSASV
jgi:hypothetical protein